MGNPGGIIPPPGYNLKSAELSLKYGGSMYRKRSPGLLVLVTVLLISISTVNVESAEIFLNPDSVLIPTGAVGTIVNLELRIDAVQNIRAYVIDLNIDPIRLEVVSVTQGTLFPTGGSTMFSWGLKDGDTILYIEDFILGWSPGAVNGPGLLANVTLRVLDTGRVDLSPQHVWAADLMGQQMAMDASGTILFLGYPPVPFDLLAPPSSATVYGTLCSGDVVEFIWSRSFSVYNAESVTYTLDYGIDPTFIPATTITVSGLAASDTVYMAPSEHFSQTEYYWRVTATGTLYSFDRPSMPFPVRSFLSLRMRMTTASGMHVTIVRQRPIRTRKTAIRMAPAMYATTVPQTIIRTRVMTISISPETYVTIVLAFTIPTRKTMIWMMWEISVTTVHWCSIRIRPIATATTRVTPAIAIAE